MCKTVFFTRYVELIAISNAGELHPFSVLGLILHLCEWKPGNLKPAASKGIQTGDGGNEALIFGAASNYKEDL